MQDIWFNSPPPWLWQRNVPKSRRQRINKRGGFTFIWNVVRRSGVKQVMPSPKWEGASFWLRAGPLGFDDGSPSAARGDYPDKLPLNSPDGRNLVYGGRRAPAFRAENGDDRSTQPEGIGENERRLCCDANLHEFTKGLPNNKKKNIRC